MYALRRARVIAERIFDVARKVNGEPMIGWSWRFEYELRELLQI